MKRMLTRKRVSKSKMAGLTLLETMFGIAIGALILIAAVIFYTSTKNSQNVSKAVTDMNTIVAQTAAYIAPGQSAIKTLTDAKDGVVVKLQDANYLPADMTDPWGQVYTATVTATAGTAATETITVTGLGATDSSCLAVQQAISGTTTKMGPTGCSFVFNL